MGNDPRFDIASSKKKKHMEKQFWKMRQKFQFVKFSSFIDLFSRHTGFASLQVNSQGSASSASALA